MTDDRNQNFELIERYLDGTLDKEGLKLFNDKLTSDPEFEREFRDMKLIRDMVKENTKLQALSLLQDVESSISRKETTKINVPMKRLVSIAASLILIATVSYFSLFNNNGSLNGEDIYTAYYEVYPNVVKSIERDGTLELITLSDKAYGAYDLGDYKTSAGLFAELIETEKKAENYFYSGIANLEIGNYEAAKNNFNTVMNNFSEFTEQSQWFLSMTLMKDGVEDEALANLASVALNNTFNKTKALKILEANNVSLRSGDNGEIGSVGYKPEGEGDSPGADDFIELRQIQYGTIMAGGKSYRFVNDIPMYELEVGDEVRFVVLGGRRSKSDFAAIVAHMK